MYNNDDIEFNGDYFDDGNRNNGKSKVVSMVLCFLLGFLGVHRFYLGKIGTGILWLLTCGFCGIGVIVDFIRICFNKMTDKDGNALKNDISDSVSKILAIVFILFYVGSLLIAVGSLIAFTKGAFDLTKEIVDDVETIVEQLPEDLENVTPEDLGVLVPDNLEITINGELITDTSNSEPITDTSNNETDENVLPEEEILNPNNQPIIVNCYEHPEDEVCQYFMQEYGLKSVDSIEYSNVEIDKFVMPYFIPSENGMSAKEVFVDNSSYLLIMNKESDDLSNSDLEEPIIQEPIVDNELEEKPEINSSMIFIAPDGLHNSMVRNIDNYLDEYSQWDYRNVGSDGYSTDIGSFEYGVQYGSLQELYDMFNNKFAFMYDVVITNIDVMNGTVELINYYTYEKYLEGEIDSLDNVYKVTGYLFPGSMIETGDGFISIGDKIEVGGIFKNIGYEGFDFYITSAYEW